MLSVTISNIAIITVKKVDNLCMIHNISAPEAISLLESPIIEERSYLQKNIVLIFSQFYLFFCFFTFFC